MKKRLVYCDRCKHKVGHFTDDDWSDGMTHEFKIQMRPEPPIIKDMDTVSLVISAVRSDDWGTRRAFLGKAPPKVDLCKPCTFTMMQAVMEQHGMEEDRVTVSDADSDS